MKSCGPIPSCVERDCAGRNAGNPVLEVLRFYRGERVFWTVLVEFALGLAAVLTGLLAFVHANFVLQTAGFLLPAGFSKAVFASSLSFSKLAFEVIPTLFFVIPSTSFGIALLPSQKLVLEGRAFEALKLILASFLAAALFSVALLPTVLVLLPLAYQAVAPASGFLLLAVIAFSLLSGGKKTASVFAFLLSGCLGLVLLSKPIIREPLFPLLSGLFAVPALLFSLDAVRPPQADDDGEGVRLDLKVVFASVVVGAFSSLLPAMTPVLLVSIMFFIAQSPLWDFRNPFERQGGRAELWKDEFNPGGRRTLVFLQASSAALVSKTFFDFAAFSAIGKARSGAVAFAAGELRSPDALAVTLAAGLAALFLSTAAVLLLCRKLPHLLPAGILAGRTHYCVLFFIVLASCALGGPAGLLALAVSSGVGVTIGLLGVNKTTALGALLVPSLAFFFSLRIF